MLERQGLLPGGATPRPAGTRPIQGGRTTTPGGPGHSTRWAGFTLSSATTQQALDCCQQALDLQREIDDHFGQAETYDSLGYAHRHLGHQQEATACYQQAVNLYGELGDRYNEADTLVALGDAHQAFGDSESARIAWQRALTILEQLDHPRADSVRARMREINEYVAPSRPPSQRQADSVACRFRICTKTEVTT